MSENENMDKWAKVFKDAGALLISKPDPKKEGLFLSAVLEPSAILDASQKLKDDGFSLLAVSTAEFSEGFLVTYLFDSFSQYFRMAIRVLLRDKEHPEVPSLYPVYQGAEWHERESYDFFGVKFTGNPNLIPILLPSDFPDPPPLRKKPEALASLKTLNFFGEEIGASPSWDLSPEKAPAPEKTKAPSDPPSGGDPK
jgi:NADH-quinone oxidoreductase subunit C